MSLSNSTLSRLKGKKTPIAMKPWMYDKFPSFPPHFQECFEFLLDFTSSFPVKSNRSEIWILHECRSAKLKYTFSQYRVTLIKRYRQTGIQIFYIFYSHTNALNIKLFFIPLENCSMAT